MTAITCEYLTQLKAAVAKLATMAFEEDMPEGDVTADVLKLSGKPAEAYIICREPISFCGEAWFETVVAAYGDFAADAQIEVTCLAKDGERLEAGSRLFRLTGDTADIVSLERTLLNFLGRAIGIANATWNHVDAVRQHTRVTQILDTRKTLPGYRYFDKYAVLCGGGQNHRLNLSDMVLIKENHMARLGGVSKAMAYVRDHLNRPVPIQVEVCDLDQLQAAIDAKTPLIMLDNFDPDLVAQAMDRPFGESQLEVSGGIDLTNIGGYAVHAPHRISIGAITHSVKAPDLSLLIDPISS